MTGAVVVASSTLPPPSVSITNPASGGKFLAPADITLMANATQSGGSVTNVRFFSGASVLGNVASAPYNFTVSGAPAGNYNFTAVAANNQGTTATSAVVNVFVLTNAILSNPVLSGGQFQLTVNGIAGQTYIIQTSPDLINWSDLVTNVAPSASFNVIDTAPGPGAVRFYRERQAR
jgi:hypothetical protein